MASTITLPSVSGPSRHEWEHHKAEILEMYKTMELKEVQRVMETKHGFVASKRMYDTRFKAWGVSKVLKRAQKERMARQLVRAQASGQRGDMFSPDDMRKLKRWFDTQMQRELKLSGSSGRGSPSSRKTSRRGVPRRSVSASDSSDSDTEQLMLTPTLSAEDSEFTMSGLFTPDELSSTETISGDDNSESIVSSLPFIPPLTTVGSERSRELVLHSVRRFFNSTLESTTTYPQGFNMLTFGSTPASKTFWTNIKNGIYIWKTSSEFEDTQWRGFQAFTVARDLAELAISTGPLDFCRELLSTLAPANTRGLSAKQLEIRTNILTYIKDIASRDLSSQHPIALLSEALINDEDCMDVSASGLDFLLALFLNQPSMSSEASHKLTETMITNMRRAGQLNDAKNVANAALVRARSHCGTNSVPARRAAVQLAHVLTNLEEYDQTLPLRLEVVKVPASPQAISVSDDLLDEYYHDGIAVHAMEDLAEYYVRFRNIVEAAIWLARAQSIALQIWGDTVDTGHITDKLNKLLEGETKGQVVDGKVQVVA